MHASGGRGGGQWRLGRGPAELGHVLLRQGRQEEHLEAALESLRGYPDDTVWEQVVVVVIGFLVQGRTDEARSALTSILETAEHHATLVPDFVVRKLHSLQQGPFFPHQGDGDVRGVTPLQSSSFGHPVSSRANLGRQPGEQQPLEV